MKRLLFPAFQWLYRLSLLRHRFSNLGLYLWLALLFSAALGIDTKTTMLHQLVIFLAALFMVSLLYIWLHHFKPLHLKIHRQCPVFVTVGEPFQYRIEIDNHSNQALFHLLIREEITYQAPSLQEFIHALEPDEYKRNRFDRDIGYYRFVWLHRQKRGLHAKVIQVAHIASKQHVQLKLEATAIRRGQIYLNALQLRQPDPLGLLFQIHRAYEATKVLALPRRYHLPPSFSLHGSRQHQQGDMTLTSNIGESDEFHTLRAYQRGDSPRHIHWPSWAKTNTPMVKQFQDEHAVRQALILDNFVCDAVQQDPQVFEEAVSVAASFSATLDTNDTLLDVMFIGNHNQRLQTGRHLAQATHMLETLASITLCHEKHFAALAQETMRHASTLSACILVLMDWDEERQNLVKKLHLSQIAVTVLLILPTNTKPPALGVMQTQPHQFKCLRVGHIAQDLMTL